MRETDGIHARRVETRRMGLDKVEKGPEVRNVSAIFVGTRHGIVGIDDVVVAENPSALGRGEADFDETEASGRRVAIASRGKA